MLFYIKLNFIIAVDALRQPLKALTPHTLTLSSRTELTGNIVEFGFTPKRPVGYDAGQYGVWALHRFVKGKPARLFTVSSAPGKNTLTLTTRISDSDFKQKLSALSIGDKVTLFGPIGRFVVPRGGKQQSLVFVVGGIGVTPVHSILGDIRQNQPPVTTELIYVAKSGDHIYQDELAKLADTSHFIGRADIDTTLEQTIQTTPKDSTFYVSGTPGFVEDTIAKLKQKGVKQIKFDGFLGY
jgi:ferredoxin-NADP reductase